MKALLAAVACLVSCSAPLFSKTLSLRDTCSAPSDFPVVVNQTVAAILIDPASPQVVRIAAALLSSDITRVSGIKPALLDSAAGQTSPLIIIGTLDSPLVSDLVRREKLSAATLTGRWEAFSITTVLAPYPGVPSALVIAGSDPRGAAYGAVTLSANLGVSPWEWWADVPVRPRSSLIIATGSGVTDQPAVKYRGIFINDEDWGLVPWAAKTFEPEVGNIGPKTYAKLFELMLRLRANTLWPGMHPTTTPFHRVPGNAAVADAYGIVLGSSHAEPMLRNNVGEWSAPKEHFNYLTHRDTVLDYWTQRVRERTSGESIFTLGMRGIHDSPIVGPKSQPERIATLEKIFAEQRELLARLLGNGDATRVSQLFCPYKEVLDDYNAGLRVPDDVTLLWPDDNFGYIRRFGTAAEQARSGGLGVYYHASYLGSPLSWLWLDSLSPALTWSEMTKAYEHGAHTFWIINAGDIKSTELSTEFFLDLAWNADRTSPAAPADFLRAQAARDFTPENASAIASILARHQALATARKPEHLSWHLPKAAYQPTALTDREIDSRLAAYAALLRDTETTAAALPAAARDAFFQLVAYPVGGAAFANQHYFQAELARRLKVRGDNPAALAAFAESEAAARQISAITQRYNEDISGGKWRGIVMVNGLSKRQWPSFQLPPVAPLNQPDALAAVAAREAARATPPLATVNPSPPADTRPGDFVERDGVVSINAGSFTSQSSLPDGGWRAIPGLGRTGSAVTVLPSTLAFTPADAPRLSYRFHVSTSGAAIARVRLLPTHPLVSGRGLRLALALNDGDPLPLAVTSGFDSKSDAWKQRVLTNATEAVLPLPAPLAPGWHTLHVVAVDAGVVVDKIILDLGGLTPSYDGPPETRSP